MKHLLDNLKRLQSGVALLETVLVLPLFMLLIGGICYFGDLLLANNRVRQSGAAFSYVAIHSNHWDAFNSALSRFQEEGFLHARAFYTQESSYVTQTNWGALISSYATLKNAKVPDGIAGMLLMGDGMYTPNDSSGDMPLDMTLGTLQEDEKSIHMRHWMVVRHRDIPYNRPSQTSVVSTIKKPSSDGLPGNSNTSDNSACVYYTQAENFMVQAYLSVDEWLALPRQNETLSTSDMRISNVFYPRKFGTFFSSEDK